jgi:hypothetical protein
VKRKPNHPSKEAAPDPETAKMMEAWEKAATPGEFHAHLKPLEGQWNTKVKFWMDPSAPPDESTGTCMRKWILGGRFLQEEFTGTDSQGQPFSGLGYSGYDNVKKKYVSTWMDTMCCGMMVSYGTCNPSGKEFTYVSDTDDPVTGKPKKMRSVLKIINNEKNIFEMYDTGPDGKEFKTLEAEYTRK